MTIGRQFPSDRYNAGKCCHRIRGHHCYIEKRKVIRFVVCRHHVTQFVGSAKHFVDKNKRETFSKRFVNLESTNLAKGFFFFPHYSVNDNGITSRDGKYFKPYLYRDIYFDCPVSRDDLKG